MKFVVSLPKVPTQLPRQLVSSHTFSEFDASLTFAQERLSQLSEPDVIIASFETPLNWWLAAHILFPAVERLFYKSDGDWLRLNGTDIENIPEKNIRANVKAVDACREKQPDMAVPEGARAKPNSESPPGKAPDLPWETFLLFARNDPNAEHRYQQYLRKVEDSSDSQLALRVAVAAREGKRASTLASTLKQKLNQGEGEGDVSVWIDQLSDSEPPRVIKNLRITLAREASFKAGKKARNPQDQNFKITLPYTVIEHGMHPQSLRSLAPSKRWVIYIDETGKEFTMQARALNESDKDLGRVVALAIPEDHELPELHSKTHATDLPLEEIQNLLKTLTKSKVGILGATLKDDIKSHSWIAAITKLIRWTLLMLPIEGRTQVIFKIEERGSYKDSDTLRALEETLIDELRQLAPGRFDQLHLSLEFASKDAPYNGYVDVIANCWGSPLQQKRSLLARTGWRGHCLLQGVDLAEIDRLYMDADSDLDSDTWFTICAHLAKEPGHSLFHDLLTQLGGRVRGDPRLWQKYLREARQRIALKTFDAGSLGRALAWLCQYQPDGERLTGLAELQLKSAQLAASNHLGDCKIDQVAEIMILAKTLKDESAWDACEAALRIAISATNAFDFTSAVPYITDWVSQPVAVTGRLNHGKLLSTLGQLHAFRGEYDRALEYFDEALEHFERLSDPTQANSNCQQTASYKAIAELDINSPISGETIKRLIGKATGDIAPRSTRKLARSASPLRFEHYLLLRWLVYSPQEEQARQDYLNCSDEWQLGEGHPWMLINAYRAWLLADSNRTDEAASYLQESIDDCSDSESSAILHWMAHCLYALGESLGLAVEQPARKCPEAPYPTDQLAVLLVSKTTEDRIRVLNKLLPFNFH